MKRLLKKNYLWAIVAAVFVITLTVPISANAQLTPGGLGPLDSAGNGSNPSNSSAPGINTTQVNAARDKLCGNNADCKTGFNAKMKDDAANISALCGQTRTAGVNNATNEYEKPMCASGANAAGSIKAKYNDLVKSGGTCAAPAGSNCTDGYYRGLRGLSNNCSGATRAQCTNAYNEGVNVSDAIKVDLLSAKNIEDSRKTTGGGAAGNNDPDIECSDSDALSWITCPVIESISTVLEQMDTAINNLLTVDTNKLFGTGTADDKDKDISNAYKTAWATFRTFALGFVVIMALVVIISTAFGYEILDAYTIRKVLPRLLIAIIGITLSWSILSFLVGFSNDVGNGIRAIIYAPFNGLDANGAEAGGNINFDDGIGPILTAFSIGTVVVMTSMGVLAMAGVALIAVICAFLVLVVRELIIIVLVVTAPIGIACLILPNTRKYWQFWQTTLAAMLIAFPFIAAMIATGKVFSKITLEFSENNLVYNMVALVAYIIPYFMLPFAFKFAGGVLGTLSGTLGAQSGGLSKGLSKYAQGKRQQSMHDMAAGNRFKGNSRLSSGLNAFTAGAAAVPQAGYNPAQWRSRHGTAMAQHHFDHAQELLEKNADFAGIKNDDDLLNVARRRGLRSTGDVRAALIAQDRAANPGQAGRFTDAQGNVVHGQALDRATSQIWRARRAGNEDAVRMAATMALPATGSGFGGGFSEMADAIVETSHGDENTATRMYGYMKGQATRAGRLDLGGSGFGTGNAQLMRRMRHDGATDQEINDAVALNALQQQDKMTIVRGRNESTTNLTGAATRRIQELHAMDFATEAEQQAAFQEIQQLTATIEGTRDTSSTYGSSRTTQIIQNGNVGQHGVQQQGIGDIQEIRRGVAELGGAEVVQGRPPQIPTDPPSEYQLQRQARSVYDPNAERVDED